MTFPWELSPTEQKERLVQELVPHVRPELQKDPVTGLWPGQRTPDDLPDFLRRTVPEGTFYYDVVNGKLAKVSLSDNPLASAPSEPPPWVAK